jgi:hypothetical protein
MRDWLLLMAHLLVTMIKIMAPGGRIFNTSLGDPTIPGPFTRQFPRDQEFARDGRHLGVVVGGLRLEHYRAHTGDRARDL